MFLFVIIVLVVTLFLTLDKSHIEMMNILYPEPKKTRQVIKYPVLYKRVDNGQFDITTAFYETLDQCKCNQPISLLTNLGQQFEEEV